MLFPSAGCTQLLLWDPQVPTGQCSPFDTTAESHEGTSSEGGGERLIEMPQCCLQSEHRPPLIMW